MRPAYALPGHFRLLTSSLAPNASDRPVRALAQPPVLDPHFATEKSRLVVLDLECVVVLAHQENSALTGVYMRIDAVKEALIDDHRADRLGRLRSWVEIDRV